MKLWLIFNLVEISIISHIFYLRKFIIWRFCKSFKNLTLRPSFSQFSLVWTKKCSTIQLEVRLRSCLSNEITLAVYFFYFWGKNLRFLRTNQNLAIRFTHFKLILNKISDLFNSKFTKSLRIQTLCQRNDQSFTLRSQQFSTNKFHDSWCISGALVSIEISKYLKYCSIPFSSKSDILIEREAISLSSWNFFSNGLFVVFKSHSAWKFNFHFNSLYLQHKLIVLLLLLRHP